MRRRRQLRASGGAGFARGLSCVTARRLLLAWLLPFAPLRYIHELDDRERRRVTPAEPELNHPGVAAVALLETRRDFIEELFHCVARLHEIERQPPRRQIAALTQRHHAIGESTQLLRLSLSGLEPLMFNQGQHQVAEQGLAMSRRAIQLAALIHVTHGSDSSSMRILFVEANQLSIGSHSFLLS